MQCGATAANPIEAATELGVDATAHDSIEQGCVEATSGPSLLVLHEIGEERRGQRRHLVKLGVDLLLEAFEHQRHHHQRVRLDQLEVAPLAGHVRRRRVEEGEGRGEANAATVWRRRRTLV